MVEMSLRLWLVLVQNLVLASLPAILPDEESCNPILSKNKEAGPDSFQKQRGRTPAVRPAVR